MKRAILALVAALGAAFLTLASAVPRPAPAAYRIFVPGKAPMKLAKYHGKVVALEFLLTHCPGCQKCGAALEKVSKEFPASQFAVVGVAVDEGAAHNIGKFRTASKATFPIGVGSLADAHKFLEKSIMYPMMMPQLVFIDKKGVIRYQFDGKANREFFDDEAPKVRQIVKKLVAE